MGLLLIFHNNLMFAYYVEMCENACLYHGKYLYKFLDYGIPECRKVLQSASTEQVIDIIRLM